MVSHSIRHLPHCRGPKKSKNQNEELVRNLKSDVLLLLQGSHGAEPAGDGDDPDGGGGGDAAGSAGAAPRGAPPRILLRRRRGDGGQHEG